MEVSPKILKRYFDVYNYPRKGYIPADVDCIVKPKKHKGGLYMGNIHGALNKSLLKALDVKAVITVAEGAKVHYEFEDGICHLTVDVRDEIDENISQFFDDCADFIAEKRKTGSVFVHCRAGISRSAAIVIAYVMKKKGYSLKGACDYVRAKRGIILPNRGFLKQLENYQKKLSLKHKMAYAFSKIF